MTARTSVSSAWTGGRTSGRTSGRTGAGPTAAGSVLTNTSPRPTAAAAASNTPPRVPGALQSVFLRSLGGEDVEKIQPPPGRVGFRMFPRLGGGRGGGDRDRTTKTKQSKRAPSPEKGPCRGDEKWAGSGRLEGGGPAPGTKATVAGALSPPPPPTVAETTVTAPPTSLPFSSTTSASGVQITTRTVSGGTDAVSVSTGGSSPPPSWLLPSTTQTQHWIQAPTLQQILTPPPVLAEAMGAHEHGDLARTESMVRQDKEGESWPLDDDLLAGDAAMSAAGSAPGNRACSLMLAASTTHADCWSPSSRTSATTLTYTTSPASASAGVATPQQFLMNELWQRGYSTTLHSTLETGYHCRPTALQQASYGTALTGAVERNDAHALRRLLGAGLSANPGNAFGEGLVHVVCRRGNARMLRILMEHGGSVQVSDDYGRTPLHDACWRLSDPAYTEDGDEDGREDDKYGGYGHTRPPAGTVIQLLLDSDPDLVLLRDARGTPPLDYVQPRDYERWIRYLRDHCLDRFWPRRTGRHYRPPPPLAMLPPHSVPVPDPENAPPLEVASMVANGQIAPQEAIVLMIPDVQDDEDDDSDDEDDDEDTDIESSSVASSDGSDDYYDCDSKCGLEIDVQDGGSSLSSDRSHSEDEEGMTEQAEVMDLCFRFGGGRAMAKRCGWKESDIAAAAFSSALMVGGKWE
jgi:hypothetical protein